MDKIKDIIATTLHTFDDEKVGSIVAALVDLGVETEADLAYIVDDDLKDLLKPIQVRKLIAAFKCSNSSSSQAAVPSYSTRGVLLPQAFSSTVKNVQNKKTVPSSCSAKESVMGDVTFITTSQSIPETYSNDSGLEPLGNIVHWEKMPTTLMAKLHSGQALELSSRHQIVHLITDHILNVIEKPTRQQINIISEYIVKLYKSLADPSGDPLGGCGFSSLSNQIMNRIDDLRRETISKQHTHNISTKINIPVDGSTMFMVNYPVIKQEPCHELNSVPCSVISCVPPSPAEIVTLPQISSALVAGSTPESSHETSRLQLLQSAVKWERIPLSLMKALQSGNVLSKEERCDLVTLIANDILHVVKQPKRHEIDLIAEHIVSRFKSLEDEIGGGHDFLSKKIVNKIDNLRRKPVSVSEQCINNIIISGARTIESKSNVCTDQLPHFSKCKAGESLNPEDDQWEELDNSLSVDSPGLETLIAQTYSEADSPESLKAKQNLMSELTKSFVTDSHVTENSVASNNFNLNLPKTYVPLLPPREVTVSPQNKSSTFVNNVAELTSDGTPTSVLDLENIVNWERIPVSVMTELQSGNVLNPKLRRVLVRFIAEDILNVIPHPRRREVYIIARSCVRRYSSLEDRIGDSVVGNGCDSLCYQVISRLENKRRKMSPTPIRNRHVTQKQTISRYGCKNWSPKFPMSETEESLEVKRIALHKLSECCMINSYELESLIASTYYCQRRSINSGTTVATVLSEWPLLFSDTGMMEHFKLLTGINLKEQLRNALTSKGKQILDFMCTASNKNVKSCLQNINALQKNESYSEIFALLMLLSSYFDEDITSLVINYEINDSSDIGSLNVPRIPCLIGVGTSLVVADHFMLVCDGVIVNKVIKEDLSALSMLFASYFVLNYRYPKSNKGLLEFIQRCLAGINPPNGTKVEGGKNIVNRTLLKLCNEMNVLTWMQDTTVNV